MKKFYSILFVACALCLFAACDDDVENPYATESSITIVSSDLDFSPAASSGTIHFTVTGGTVTATPSSSWCTATVSGDSVIVEVEENVSVSGRSTVVVLRNGNDSVQMPVTQLGIVLNPASSAVGRTNEATTVKVPVQANLEVGVVSYPDWAPASIVDDTLVIDFSANETGHMRMDYVAINAGAVVDSVKVSQADFDTDIAGTYRLYYRNDVEGTLRSMNVTLTEDELQLSSYRLYIPITYDSDNMQLTVETGSYIGTNSNYYIYLVFGGGAGLYWTAYVSDVYMTAPFTYDDTNGIQAVFSGTLNAGAGYGTIELDCFMLEAYSTNEISSDGDVGTLLTLYYPYLQRDPSSTTSASSYVLR